MGVATDWPSTLRAPARCEFWPDEVGALLESPYDGTTQFTYRFHRWRAILEFGAMTVPQAWAVLGFLGFGRGQRSELNIPNFGLKAKVGTKTGSVTVDGLHSAGATTLNITGGSGAFAAGDVIHLSNASHDALHLVIGGDGTTAVDIAPELRWGQAGGSTVFHRGQVSVLEMRETMVVTSTLRAPQTVPSSSTGMIAPGWAVEFVSSGRTPA